jgi:two-component system CheB/CheR fusion protein
MSNQSVANKRDRLEALRTQALEALSHGEKYEVSFTQANTIELHTLLEELRVYQAELEIQNQELTDTAAQREQFRQYYQYLFDSNPTPTLLLSIKGEIEEANAQAKIALGLDKVKIVRKRSLYSLLSHDAALELNNALSDIQATPQQPYECLLCVTHDNKRYAAHLLAIEPSVVRNNGQFLLILRDLTDEERLALQRRIFERVINQNEDMIVVIDQNRRVVSHNEPAKYALSPTGTEVSFIDLLGVLPASVIDGIDEMLQSSRAVSDLRQTLLHFSSQLYPRKLNRNCVAKVFQVVINEHGEIGCGVFISDETDRIQLDKELKVALSIYDMSSQAIIIADDKQNITYVNHAFETITGYSAREVKGKNPRILSSGRHTRSFYKEMWDSVQGQGSWSGEIWNRRKTGEEYPEWLTISRYPSDGDVQHYIATFTDITNLKANEKRIHDLAYYDPLTGAGNRRLLKEHVVEYIKHADAESGFCMMFVDLDRFKIINDTLGHDVGDELLKLVVRRISGVLRETDKVYRLGGDEFLIVIHQISSQKAAKKAAHINRMLQSPFFIKDNEVITTCSLGVVMYPNDGDTFEDLLKHADIAMYRAKDDGRNGFHFFDAELLEAADKRLKMERKLRCSLADETLCWHYQPQFDITTGELYGFEALLRIDTQEACNVEELISIAEHTGLVHHITYKAFEHALAMVATTLNGKTSCPRVSVNMSALDFRREEHFNRIVLLLEKSPHLTAYLDIEITESIVMDDADGKIQQLETLKSLGVSIHIDDFGTGYSSLAYMTEFPIDILKIDRQFVSKIGDNKRAESVCKTIIRLAQALRIQSLAEGVETQAQLDFLKKSGCKLAQGYFFGRPAPMDCLSQIY